jgi:hypothetical protein
MGYTKLGPHLLLSALQLLLLLLVRRIVGWWMLDDVAFWLVGFEGCSRLGRAVRCCLAAHLLDCWAACLTGLHQQQHQHQLVP